MSTFGDGEKDDVLYEIEEFLRKHQISELLEVVKYACKEKEEGYLD